MHMAFKQLPRTEREYLLEVFALPEREHRIMHLKYIREYSYSEIAAELCISEKSVGKALNRAKRHMVDIAVNLHPIADERTRMLIDVLGWLDIDFPTERNRKALRRGPSS